MADLEMSSTKKITQYGLRHSEQLYRFTVGIDAPFGQRQ
jgi:hypothetical protein